MQCSFVLQTITDHVGVTSEAFSGVATICVTKTGKYLFSPLGKLTVMAIYFANFFLYFKIFFNGRFSTGCFSESI